MEANVRLTRPNDINTMRDLDIKSYDYPLEMAEWQDLINNSGQKDKARCVIIEAYNRPLGFAVWRIETPQQGKDDIICYLYRLGVRDGVRNQGLGTVLLRACEDNAKRMQADKIRCTIPDFKCQAGDPDDVSGFLTSCGFRATGEIVEEYKFMYGRWADGFIFEKELGVGHAVA